MAIDWYILETVLNIQRSMKSEHDYSRFVLIYQNCFHYIRHLSINTYFYCIIYRTQVFEYVSPLNPFIFKIKIVIEKKKNVYYVNKLVSKQICSKILLKNH